MTDELESVQALKAEIDALLEPVKDLPADDPQRLDVQAKCRAILKERRPDLFAPRRPIRRGCCSRHPVYGKDWPIRLTLHPNETDLARIKDAPRPSLEEVREWLASAGRHSLHAAITARFEEAQKYYRDQGLLA